jgi:hypothetical protein
VLDEDGAGRGRCWTRTVLDKTVPDETVPDKTVLGKDG